MENNFAKKSYLEYILDILNINIPLVFWTTMRVLPTLFYTSNQTNHLREGPSSWSHLANSAFLCRFFEAKSLLTTKPYNFVVNAILKARNNMVVLEPSFGVDRFLLLLSTGRLTGWILPYSTKSTTLPVIGQPNVELIVE